VVIPGTKNKKRDAAIIDLKKAVVKLQTEDEIIAKNLLVVEEKWTK